MTRKEAHQAALSQIERMTEKDFNDYLVNTHSEDELKQMTLEDKKMLIVFLEFNYIEGCPEDYLEVVYNETPQYNVAGDLAFEIMTTNPEQPTNEEIIAALERRIAILKRNPDEIGQGAVNIYDIPKEPTTSVERKKWLRKK